LLCFVDKTDLMTFKKDFCMNSLLKLTAAAIGLVLAGGAQAGIITNDTDILSGAGHEQLSTWLGQDVDLTRIFAKGIDGVDGYAWHSAVDNKGATITVMEIFNGSERTIIGGYNQFSWLSSRLYTNSPSTNNFLFNLTTGIGYQKNTNNIAQTINAGAYGATFGSGYDLYINSALSGGYTKIGNSYGDRSRYNTSAYQNEFAGSFNNWTIGAYETFTLSGSTGNFGSGATALVDENGLEIVDASAPLALASLGLFGLMGFRRKS
jgi:hypothetical protein